MTLTKPIMNATTSSLLLAFACSALFAKADSHSAIATSASGGRSVSPNYANDCSIGDITGSANSGPELLRAGYVAEIADAVSFNISAPATNLNEGDSLQLTVFEQLDDGTISTASDWTTIAGPISSITPTGLITAGNVYQDAPATIRGSADGLTQVVNLTIRNTGVDDLGIYANDGIPDTWQTQYFGENNPLGRAYSDADQTGQNNLFKYIAGLNPTNPASIFNFEIAGVTTAQSQLKFGPYLPDRTYTIEYKTDLNAPSFTILSNSVQTLNGSTMSVIDTNANSPHRFYRIQISHP